MFNIFFQSKKALTARLTFLDYVFDLSTSCVRGLGGLISFSKAIAIDCASIYFKPLLASVTKLSTICVYSMKILLDLLKVVYLTCNILYFY